MLDGLLVHMDKLNKVTPEEWREIKAKACFDTCSEASEDGR